MNVKEKLQWIKNLDGKGRANCITNDNKKKIRNCLRGTESYTKIQKF